MKSWVRIFLISIALVLITAGALNDGVTGWFWGGIFIWLFYFALPYNRKVKGVLVLVVFLLMYGVSYYKYYSPWVYPVIGQKVTLIEDIPLRGLGDYDWYDYGWYLDFEKNNRHIENQTIKETRHVSKGSVFYVTKINVSHADLGLNHNYILSDGQTEFAVSSSYLKGYFGDMPEELKKESFCSKVQWKYCDQVNLYNQDNQVFLDPMYKPFRLLTGLIYYPVSPFIFCGWVKEKVGF